MKTFILFFCIVLASPAYAGADNCESKARRILKTTAIELGVKPILVGTALALVPTVGRLVFMPQTELAKGTGFEIVGPPDSRKIWEQLAYDLAGFDREMSAFGFKKSSLTKIAVFERTILPGAGPMYYVFINPANLWRKSQADDTIVMKPALYRRVFVTDPSALMHEWVHAFLHDQYHKSSYVLKNRSIQEALADFLPLHYREDYLWKFRSLIGRDITQRPDLPLSSFGDPYSTGKAISYTLWKLRERTGKERVVSWFKPFVDGLDQYYPSFAKHNYGRIKRTLLKSGIIQTFRAVEYEYFMAVLKKTLQEESEMSEASQFVDEIAFALGLNVASIDALTAQLTR